MSGWVSRVAVSKIIAVFLLAGMGVLPAIGQGQPLKVEIMPLKQIYSSHEGIVVKVVFTAREKVRLCMEKDFLSQMGLKISRPGVGVLPLKPLVSTNNREVFQQKMRIHWLEPGESLTLRTNLKRYHFDKGYQWEPAEYTVNGFFNLCSQTGGEEYSPLEEETPVPLVRPGWFMIMS